MDWFTVDKQGLGRLIERKGKAFVLFELISNAWDTKPDAAAEVRRVDVTLARVPRTPFVRVTVEDDHPQGFTNLAHSFTLFADSEKKDQAEKRGRFNLGEKLVLALCSEAEIVSTTGGVRFDGEGRHTLRRKREAGSVFSGLLRMTDAEIAECEAAVRRLIVPEGVVTTYNGAVLPTRSPKRTVEASLATEIADADGVLRKSTRKTSVRIYEPLAGEPAMLYEMGIPVVETSDRWHVDVQQKCPLTFDRDNVPPSFLSRVRALAVEAMRETLTTEDANAVWVRDAMQHHGDKLSNETVTALATLRFGEKRVAYDPSDREANHIAVAQGYTLVHGSQLKGEEWDLMRRAGALPPAGQVTPSPRPHVSLDGEPQVVVPESEWTAPMRAVIAYVRRVAHRLIDAPAGAVAVKIVDDPAWPFAATYGLRELTFNLGRLGHGWFGGPRAAITDLLIHELGHEYESNHLSREYYHALTRLAGRVTELALAEPGLFTLADPDAAAARDAGAPAIAAAR